MKINSHDQFVAEKEGKVRTFVSLKAHRKKIGNEKSREQKTSRKVLVLEVRKICQNQPSQKGYEKFVTQD